MNVITTEKQSSSKICNQISRGFIIKNPYPQPFSLPENIIYYIVKHPININSHLNLIKCCKLLFCKSRIVPVQNLECLKYSNEKIRILLQNYTEIEDIDFEYQLFFQIWIFNGLKICSSSKSNLASTLIERIHKCTVKELILCQQVLTIGELQFITAGGKLEYVYFYENIIKNRDGSITDFEKVFEVLLCKKMEITFPLEDHGIGKYTSQNIGKILQSKVNFKCDLKNIPQNFDIQAFSGFLKENIKIQHHSINLSYCSTISDEYKNQLEKFIIEIIQYRDTASSAFLIITFYDEPRFVPIIKFNGQNDGNLKKLKFLRDPFSNYFLQGGM